MKHIKELKEKDNISTNNKTLPIQGTPKTESYLPKGMDKAGNRVLLGLGLVTMLNTSFTFASNDLQGELEKVVKGLDKTTYLPTTVYNDLPTMQQLGLNTNDNTLATRQDLAKMIVEHFNLDYKYKQSTLTDIYYNDVYRLNPFRDYINILVQNGIKINTTGSSTSFYPNKILSTNEVIGICQNLGLKYEKILTKDEIAKGTQALNNPDNGIARNTLHIFLHNTAVELGLKKPFNQDLHDTNEFYTHTREYMVENVSNSQVQLKHPVTSEPLTVNLSQIKNWTPETDSVVVAFNNNNIVTIIGEVNYTTVKGFVEEVMDDSIKVNNTFYKVQTKPVISKGVLATIRQHNKTGKLIVTYKYLGQHGKVVDLTPSGLLTYQISGKDSQIDTKEYSIRSLTSGNNLTLSALTKGSIIYLDQDNKTVYSVETTTVEDILTGYTAGRTTITFNTSRNGTIELDNYLIDEWIRNNPHILEYNLNERILLRYSGTEPVGIEIEINHGIGIVDEVENRTNLILKTLGESTSTHRYKVTDETSLNLKRNNYDIRDLDEGEVVFYVAKQDELLHLESVGDKDTGELRRIISDEVRIDNKTYRVLETTYVEIKADQIDNETLKYPEFYNKYYQLIREAEYVDVTYYSTSNEVYHIVIEDIEMDDYEFSNTTVEFRSYRDYDDDYYLITIYYDGDTERYLIADNSNNRRILKDLRRGDDIEITTSTKYIKGYREITTLSEKVR